MFRNALIKNCLYGPTEFSKEKQFGSRWDLLTLPQPLTFHSCISKLSTYESEKATPLNWTVSLGRVTKCLGVGKYLR